MIKKLIKKYRANIQRAEYKKTLPNCQRHDDVYLVEFPKSGITWLSTIISNCFLQYSGKKQQATFYNIQQLIPVPSQ